MKKLLLSSIAIACLSSAAVAADLPQSYMKAPIAPAWSWTGSYVGLNVGYGVSRSDSSDNFLSPAGVVALGGSNRLAADGVLGGAQIGYNWQTSPTWLWGVEADFQGANIKGSSQVVLPPIVMNLESKVNWFGTVRGRLGYIVNPATVAYVTGGFAYGETQLSANNNFGDVGAAGTAKQTRGGYTVGGGMETRLSGNWSVKAEYLYVNLGNASINAPTSINFPSVVFTQVGSGQEQFHVVRAGLNYRF